MKSHVLRFVSLTLTLVLFAQSGGRAQAGGALPYAKSFLMTGNYAVGGVDLDPRTALNGFITGTIHIGDLPANADIVSAFLFWETIATAGPATTGTKFQIGRAHV